MPSENRFTPLLHKEVSESNNYSDKKAVCNFLSYFLKITLGLSSGMN